MPNAIRRFVTKQKITQNSRINHSVLHSRTLQGTRAMNYETVQFCQTDPANHDSTEPNTDHPTLKQSSVSLKPGRQVLDLPLVPRQFVVFLGRLCVILRCSFFVGNVVFEQVRKCELITFGLSANRKHE